MLYFLSSILFSSTILYNISTRAHRAAKSVDSGGLRACRRLLQATIRRCKDKLNVLNTCYGFSCFSRNIRNSSWISAAGKEMLNAKWGAGMLKDNNDNFWQLRTTWHSIKPNDNYGQQFGLTTDQGLTGIMGTGCLKWIQRIHSKTCPHDL